MGCKKEPAEKCWKLVFEDNFNTTYLDSTEFRTDYPWHRFNHSQIYLNEMVTQENGYLVLTGVVNDTMAKGVHYWEEDKILQDDHVNYRYFTMRSGMVYSLQSYLYGKFEVRAKVPEGKGLWPAFWLYGECAEEIDIFEFDCEFSNRLHTAVHFKPYCNGNEDGQLADNYISRKRFSDDFHVYSVIWEKDRIIWKLDGRTIREDVKFNDPIYAKSFPSQPMNVILNLALGGNYTKSQPDASSLPAKMYIDYLKVYQ